jgi:hypothetical protein
MGFNLSKTFQALNAKSVMIISIAVQPLIGYLPSLFRRRIPGTELSPASWVKTS